MGVGGWGGGATKEIKVEGTIPRQGRQNGIKANQRKNRIFIANARSCILWMGYKWTCIPSGVYV